MNCTEIVAMCQENNEMWCECYNAPITEQWWIVFAIGVVFGLILIGTIFIYGLIRMRGAK